MPTQWIMKLGAVAQTKQNLSKGIAGGLFLLVSKTETEEGGGGESNEGQAAYSPSVWSERAGKTSSVAGGRRREVGVGGDQCAPMMLRPARRKR